MSEADWWLCPECSSLNNLSARKCYSCRKRKPRGAVKASEVLGYFPVVSWDGKVTLVKPIAPSPPEDVLAAREAEAAAAVPPPPPLREPVRRSIAALTPQYPAPVRATYADASMPPVAAPRVMPAPPMPPVPMVAGPPPVPGMPPVPQVPPGPMVAGPPTGAGPPVPPVSPVPMVAGPPVTGPPVARPPMPMRAGPGPMPPVPPVAAPGAPPDPGPGFATTPPSPRPMVPMGPGPAAPVGQAPTAPEPQPPMPHAEEQWPHWRELLDGPTPHAERLRVQSEDAALAGRLSGSGPVFRVDVEAPLGAAMRRASADTPSPGFVPWPEADRLPEPDEEASENPEPPSERP